MHKTSPENRIKSNQKFKMNTRILFPRKEKRLSGQLRTKDIDDVTKLQDKMHTRKNQEERAVTSRITLKILNLVILTISTSMKSNKESRTHIFTQFSMQ